MPSIYVDADRYRARTGDTQTDPKNVLPVVLSGASRLIDRELGIAPGHMAPIASTVYVFDAFGGSRLRLRDDAGAQYFLRTITADSCKIDTDGDGGYDDYLLDLSDVWLRALPQNAVAHGEAYTSLELLDITSASVTRWPDAPASVQITGTWGMPRTPEIIQELVIDLAHNMLQAGNAGGLGVPSPDGTLLLSNNMWPVLKRAREEYSHRRIKAA